MFKYHVIRVECVSHKSKIDQIKDANSSTLPEGIISKLKEVYDQLNTDVHQNGDELLVPVLSPYINKHKQDDIVTDDLTEITKTPKKFEPTVQQVTENKKNTEPKYKEKEIKPTTQIQFRNYPYTFSRPGETIEAVIRLYNDLSISRHVIDKLVYEFSKINKESLPPKLGQTVQIPVLLPFCYRHENDNKIFTDGK